MDISLAKLQQLVAVARCGSFSRAAIELNLSQPALSRSIALIEARYGFAIFNRVGHGVELTPVGSQVIEQAEPLLQGLRVFESNMNLLAEGGGGTLAVGMAPLLASQFLARCSMDFFGAGAAVQLRTMIRPGIELLNALKNDEIELMFFPEAHLEETDEIEVELIGSVRPICVVRRGHPLLGQDTISIDELAVFPWACSTESALGPQVPSKARMICDNYHILREAVLSTDLVCICSEAFVEAEARLGNLVPIVVEGLPLRPTEIYVAKLRGRIHSPLAIRILRIMQNNLDS